MRVYLSGPIKECSNEEATEWRQTAEEYLHTRKIKTLNPMRRDYRDDPVSHLPALVENDKIDIELSDVVLVNFISPSVGTSMEVLLGWQMGKRVIVVSSDWTDDAWLVYHSHNIYRTLDEALARIEELRVEYEAVY